MDLDFAMDFDANQQSEADKKLMVKFFKGTIKNEVKSAAEGRPIFDEIDLVMIMTPGSRDNFVGDATEQYQRRFPTQWDRYKKNQTQDDGGTPLNLMPWVTSAQVEEFKYFNIRTVEHLAGCPDSVAQKFMGIQQFKQKAQAFLEAAKDRAPILKMQAELQQRDDKLAEQDKTIQELAKRLETMERKKATA